MLLVMGWMATQSPTTCYRIADRVIPTGLNMTHVQHKKPTTPIAREGKWLCPKWFAHQQANLRRFHLTYVHGSDVDRSTGIHRLTGVRRLLSCKQKKNCITYHHYNPLGGQGSETCINEKQ